MNYKPKRINFTWDDLSTQERENYVNQDYVPLKEYLSEGLENHYFESIWGNNKSDKRLIYELYFLDGKPIPYIMCYVSYSKRHIERIIKKIKTSIDKICNTDLKRNIVKLHIQEGFNYDTISKILQCNYDYVCDTITVYLKEVMK